MNDCIVFGNILATKNQIAQKIWVIHIIEIPRAKSSIQNCLSYGFQERVGIGTAEPETF